MSSPSASPTPADSSLSRSSAVGLILLFTAFAVLLGVVMGSNVRPPQRVTVEATPEVTADAVAVVTGEATPEVVAAVTPEAVAVAYLPEQIDAGRDVFLVTCSACHGQNAQGIQGLGKNLITSDYVHGLTDEELVQFIIVGRMPSDPLNTTGLPMPARGGNPGLTDDQIFNIVAYLRSETAVQDLGVVGGDVQAAPQPNPEVVAIQPFVLPGVVAAASAAGDEAVVPASYTAAEVYTLSCAGCHGADGRGVIGLDGNIQPGSNLRESDLWGNGEAIYALLTGQPQFDPVGGFVHPVRDTLYPHLNDQALAELIGYLATLE